METYPGYVEWNETNSDTEKDSEEEDNDDDDAYDGDQDKGEHKRMYGNKFALTYILNDLNLRDVDNDGDRESDDGHEEQDDENEDIYAKYGIFNEGSKQIHVTSFYRIN